MLVHQRVINLHQILQSDVQNLDIYHALSDLPSDIGGHIQLTRKTQSRVGHLAVEEKEIAGFQDEQLPRWGHRVNIEKDVENPWFSNDNDLQMVGFPNLSYSLQEGSYGKWSLYGWFVIYLLRMVIFHSVKLAEGIILGMAARFAGCFVDIPRRVACSKAFICLAVGEEKTSPVQGSVT